MSAEAGAKQQHGCAEWTDAGWRDPLIPKIRAVEKATPSAEEDGGGKE